jgi:hypothetical protein
MSTLPFVLLKTHVMMMVTGMEAMTNRTTLARVGGKFQAGTQKKGRCHNAQSGPRIRLPTKGPCNRYRRGNAKPRQPGSSPTGPWRNT